jgi:hypothetical protein
LKPAENITSQLNLITCAGTYNPATGKYPDRVVVVSKLLEI